MAAYLNERASPMDELNSDEITPVGLGNPRATADESGGEGVRARLLSAALREFASSGFRSASIREITGAAGVSPGNVGHLFGSKLALFEAVLRSFLDPLRERKLDSLAALETYADNPTGLQLFDASMSPTVELFLGPDGPLKAQLLTHSTVEHEIFWPAFEAHHRTLFEAYEPAFRRAFSHLEYEEARYRWANASRLFIQALTPGFQNVDDPKPATLAEVAQARRLAALILSAAPMKELELPKAPWERSSRTLGLQQSRKVR